MLLHSLIKLNQFNSNRFLRCLNNLNLNIRLKSSAIPIKIAVIGSGPSGFYTTQSLLKVNKVFKLNLRPIFIFFYQISFKIF